MAEDTRILTCWF